MLKRFAMLSAAVFAIAVGAAVDAQGPRRVALGDWPEMRGPNRDGISTEAGLPDKWALNGENFLWRAPYGGRSTPIVMGNRVFIQNPVGRGAELQERIMALDADTGKLVWEYRFNIFQSDVPPHRVGWASPAADPETGNIYALGAGATVVALSRDGKLLWDRSIGEEFAAFTTHGGRTAAPMIDGDLVIVNAALSNWGSMGARGHRFIALDKRTGDIIYVAQPGGRPYDTSFSPGIIATINGMRQLIVGGGDGAVHSMKPQTGEKLWSYIATKRAINTAVVVSGTSVIVSHGDENLDSSVMGMLAAIDGSQSGDIKTAKWRFTGTEFGFSSPIVHGQHLYQLDGSSELHAYDLETGKTVWTQQLGTLQKASPVFADGKLYVGTETGTFVIVRPLADRARNPQPGDHAAQHRQRGRVGRHGRTNRLGGRDFARARVLHDERRGLCNRTEDGQDTHRVCDRRARAQGRGRASARAGVADGADADARPDRQAARAAVRRQGPLPARRQGHVVAARA